MAKTTLELITPKLEDAVRALRVQPSQEGFVATNERSLEQGAAEEHAWMRAICADGAPVGFVMMHVEPAKGVYYVWRFMMDANHQGLGHGRRAMALLVEHVRSQPNATEITLSHRATHANRCMLD